jgi:glycosyltransferase involved in cell wall biosynthesis
MKLTVVICTWNRCELLRQALEQLTAMVVPPGVEWELLVVNNNSTDATDAVVRSFEGRLPVRLLFEPTPGKTNALNRAVREAAGDWILNADEDALVDGDWMAAYWRAIQRWPDVAFFGGAIEPWFGGTPPAWLPPALTRIGGVYAISETPAGPIRPTDSPLPFGANWAVRADVQRSHPYDPRLGPRPGKLVAGEETAVVLALLADGFQGRWLPEARVRHHIARNRQTLGYVRKFFFDRAAVYGHRAPRGRGLLLGRPLWMWRQAFVHETLYWLRRASGRRPEVWIVDLQFAASAWGGLFGRDRSSNTVSLQEPEGLRGTT